jgi:hypothetical protein
MFAAAMFFSGCTYGQVSYRSNEGSYDGKTDLTELSRAVYLDRMSAAEADKVHAQAEVNRAAAEAIRKDPSLLRDVPIPGNPNDVRFVGTYNYNERGDCKGNCGGSNYGNQGFDDGLRRAMQDSCRRNPNQPGCR